MSLIVTGSIGIDTIQAPTGTADSVLGGSSIYFSAAASFFTPVRLVGAVGEDFPTELEAPFNHFDIDLEGLEKRAGSKTFRWTGKYLEDMNERETLSVELNVLAEALAPVPESYKDSKYVFLANAHPGGQLELLKQFPSRELVVADTMDLWIETEPDLLKAVLKELDGLVLNDGEAKQLTGKRDLIEAAKAIIAMGPKFVVIKKGEHGAMIEHADGRVSLPAYPADAVIDPTGAGDSFAGGMMGYLASIGEVNLQTLKRAMAFGTVVASYNIEAFSLGRLMEITPRDIDDRLSEYAGMLNLGE